MSEADPPVVLRSRPGRMSFQVPLALSHRSGRAIGAAVTTLKTIAGIATLTLLSACGAVSPYVYIPGEFNRQSPGFNVEPADIEAVAICYQPLVTDHQSVVALAEERCRAFDRTAEFLSTGYGQCPLATIARAQFACVRP